jgi:hypothetical protein
MGFALNFLAPNLPEDLRYLIPNSYGQKPSFMLYDRDIEMMGIVLVALEDIQEEELFLNYRLNPNLELPDWYHSVDPDEDERRWSGD